MQGHVRQTRLPMLILFLSTAHYSLLFGFYYIFHDSLKCSKLMVHVTGSLLCGIVKQDLAGCKHFHHLIMYIQQLRMD